MTEVLHALFVAWQHPVSRRFSPVGRLAQIAGNNCQDCFEFVYVHAAEEAQEEGFLPFLSFPELDKVYRSRELFPMFANRLLPKSRPDFPEYIEQLGLPPATVSPITILSRSTGRRATDTLELFPLPEFEANYGYRTWFWAHSLRYVPDASQERIATLAPDERLFPMCDVQNAVVPSAIALRTTDLQIVGYMPSYLLEDAHTLQQTCEFCEVYVDRVNPPPIPLQQRLLCRLESCWPDGFVPYSTERYQPLVPDAAEILAPQFTE